MAVVGNRVQQSRGNTLVTNYQGGNPVRQGSYAVSSVVSGTPYDPAGITDSVLGSDSLVVEFSQGLSADLVLPASTSDSVSTSLTSGGTAWTATVTDTVGAADSLTVEFTQQKTADPVGLTDTLVFTRANTVDDTAGLTDNLSFTLSVVLTDNTGLTDTPLPGKAITVDDSVGLTDSLAFTRVVVVDDTAGLTDTRTHVWSDAVTDQAGITDTLAFARDVVLTDQAGLTDTLAFTRALVVDDAAGLTDAASTSLTGGGTAWTATVTDTVLASDSLTILQTRNLAADTVLAGDTLAFTRSVAVTDQAGLTDSASTNLSSGSTSWTVTVDDLTGVTDSNGGFYSGDYSSDYGDGAPLISFTRTLVLTDQAGLTDSASTSLSAGGTAFTATVNDTAGLTDNQSFSRYVNLTDDTGSTDNRSYFRQVTITDLAGIRDTQFIGSLILTDSVGLTDTVLVTKTGHRRIFRTPVMGLNSLSRDTLPRERGLMRHYAGYPKRGLAVSITGGVVREHRVVPGDLHLTADYIFLGGHENVVDDTAAAILEAAGYSLITVEA